MLRNSRVSEHEVASLDRLNSMELVSYARIRMEIISVNDYNIQNTQENRNFQEDKVEYMYNLMKACHSL
jgi:hypothetical protein